MLMLLIIFYLFKRLYIEGFGRLKKKVYFIGYKV